MAVNLPTVSEVKGFFCSIWTREFPCSDHDTWPPLAQQLEDELRALQQQLARSPLSEHVRNCLQTVAPHKVFHECVFTVESCALEVLVKAMESRGAACAGRVFDGAIFELIDTMEEAVREANIAIAKAVGFNLTAVIKPLETDLGELHEAVKRPEFFKSRGGKGKVRPQRLSGPAEAERQSSKVEWDALVAEELSRRST